MVGKGNDYGPDTKGESYALFLKRGLSSKTPWGKYIVYIHSWSKVKRAKVTACIVCAVHKCRAIMHVGGKWVVKCLAVYVLNEAQSINTL